MRKFIVISAIFSLGVLWFSSIAFAVDFPKPIGYVNDFAHILKPNEVSELEQTLQSFEKQTSNQIVVVTVSSFQGLDSFTYSQQLFTAWGIGQKSRNNGILFLLGPKDGFPFPERGDMFINVGKGLEGALPDSITGSIIRHEVVPQFQAKNYFNGISAGVTAIMQATQNEYTAVADTPTNNVFTDNAVFFFWVGCILLSWLSSFLGRTKSWWLGGVLGGVGGAIAGFVFLSGLWIAFSAAGLAAVGFVLDYVVSKNYQQRLKDGKPTGFWKSGGGFWFGGGGFGGGGGGGFGGFGGGGSGGGGAGGSW